MCSSHCRTPLSTLACLYNQESVCVIPMGSSLLGAERRQGGQPADDCSRLHPIHSGTTSQEPLVRWPVDGGPCTWGTCTWWHPAHPPLRQMDVASESGARRGCICLVRVCEAVCSPGCVCVHISALCCCPVVQSAEARRLGGQSVRCVWARGPVPCGSACGWGVWRVVWARARMCRHLGLALSSIVALCVWVTGVECRVRMRQPRSQDAIAEGQR